MTLMKQKQEMLSLNKWHSVIRILKKGNIFHITLNMFFKINEILDYDFI